jgi:hypothetical protein
MFKFTYKATIILVLFLVSCSSPATAKILQTPETDTSVKSETTPTSTTSLPGSMSSLTTQTSGSQITRIPVDPSSTNDGRLLAQDWQEWPVIPQVSPWLRNVYAQGLAQGNNPNSFSKIGDCQNVKSVFLPFDLPPYYRLGEKYSYLMPTIDHFSGSWMRESQAVRGGFNVASVLSPFFSDKEVCNNDETPLDCEFRLNKPSIAIISMETWTSRRPPEVFEEYLSQIVEYILSHNAIPILATKADNTEGDQSINEAIARVAYNYDIPLWNFWAAVQPIPWKGLTEDGFHLTVGKNYFDDPLEMERAWPVRNLTALQAIDAVFQAVK